MIEVAQGTPGSGKSAVAVARAIMHLKKGGVVAANFSLVDGWADSVANHNLIARLFGTTHKKALSMYKRFYRVDSLPAIRKIFPLQQAEGLYKDKGGFSEGEGLLLLDECQLIFNTRNCMAGSKNLDWIEFFTQHRKLHWNVILIAHTIEMIDSQIRPVAEYESRFRNLQKVKIPFTPFPMSPFPLFLVIKRYAGLGAGASVVHSRDCFPLPLWAARLYDSLLVFSADSWGQDTEPHHCGAAPVDPMVKVPLQVIRRSILSGPHWDDYIMTIS